MADDFDISGLKSPQNIETAIDLVGLDQPFTVYEDHKRSGSTLWSYKGRTWWDEYDNFWTDERGWGQEELIYACKKARSARFEHGRSGN